MELLRNLRGFPASQLAGASVWPRGRRAAVLVVLFAGRAGEIRVLLTKRSRQLRQFAGHVSLPGGKADGDESAVEAARREAYEEIGLPLDSELRRQGLRLEVLNELPCYLSRSFLSVRPVVCWLDRLAPTPTSTNSGAGPSTAPAGAATTAVGTPTAPTDASGTNNIITQLQLVLNPGETASVFSIPLFDMIDDGTPKEYLKKQELKHKWGKIMWPLQHFYYPADSRNEVSWIQQVDDLSSDEEMVKAQKVKDVWGLTARIIYDIAHIVKNESDDLKHYIGNENLIYALKEFGGQMQDGKRSDWEQAMLEGKRGYSYDQVIPRHLFKKIVEEYKL